MLGFTENVPISGSNAERTEYLPEFEIAVHQKTIFGILFTKLFILQTLSNKTNFFMCKNFKIGREI